MKKLAAALLLAACAAIPEPLFIPGEQGQIFVSDGGSGPGVPVLFIHGGGGNVTHWNGQLGHVRQSRRAIAFDLRGMGRSDVPGNGDYSIAAMIGDIHRLVNTLDIDRFVLVGHSYGGTVAAMYAAAHPERVAGVIYADATGDMTGSDQEWNGWLDTLRQDKHAVLRKMWEPVLETASADVKHAVYFSGDRTSTEVFVGALAGVREVNVARAVASYKGPVFAIVATESPYSLHVQNRAIPTRRMTGAGHWLMMEKPAEFNAILDEFLARIDYAEGVRAFLFPFSTTSGERVARS